MADHRSPKRPRSNSVASGRSDDSIDYSEDPQTKQRLAEKCKGPELENPIPREITNMEVKDSTPRFCVSFKSRWLKFGELTDEELATISESMKQKRNTWHGYPVKYIPRERFPSDCRVSSCSGSAVCDGELYMLVTVESWVEAKDLKNLDSAVYGLIDNYTQSMDWTKLRASHGHRSNELGGNQEIESRSEGAPALPID